MSKRWNMLKMAATIALAGSLASACAGGDSVDGNGVGINRVSQGLTSGTIKLASGTYGAGCVNRSGSWSVAIDGYAGSMDNAPLSVVKNNTACVLTLSSLTTDSTYIADPGFAMTALFQGSASAFALAPTDAGISPTAFYANARLSAVSFASSFSVLIPYSDNPRLATAEDTADYAVSTSSATSNSVAAPNYTIDMTGLSVETDVANVVQSAGGTADTTDGSQTGEGYVVLASAPGTSYAALHTAYTGATPTAIAGANPTIPASAFTLVGEDLTSTVARYVIIAHTSAGVTSYQLISITFNPHS